MKLLLQHDAQQLPVGRASALTEDARGLVTDFRVSRTPRGDEALTLAGDGTLDGASVGMTVIADRWNAARNERDVLEAKLHEVSLTPWPAYESAGVLAIRSTIEPAAEIDLFRRRLRLYDLTA